MSILYRHDKENQKQREEEYVDLFGNPFPAAVRGILINKLIDLFL